MRDSRTASWHCLIFLLPHWTCRLGSALSHQGQHNCNQTGQKVGQQPYCPCLWCHNSQSHGRNQRRRHWRWCWSFWNKKNWRRVRILFDFGLGQCGYLTMDHLNLRYYTFIEQCKNPKACTIILRGASKDVLNEIERNFQDAMNVARNVMIEPYLTPGGGACEMEIAKYSFDLFSNRGIA
jgi:hypothetical protein